MTKEQSTKPDSFMQQPPLTVEEREDLAKNNPALLDQIENGAKFVSLNALYTYRHPRKSVEEEAKSFAEEFKKPIIASIQQPQQASLLPSLGYLPADMTRISFYFPKNKNEIDKNERIENFLISDTIFGMCVYSGKVLSTYHEDFFLALCGYLHSVNNKYVVAEDFATTQKDKYGKNKIDPKTKKPIAVTHRKYGYRGPALPILQMLGYNKPGKNAYERLRKILDDFSGATVKYTIKTGKTKTGRERQPKSFIATPIFSMIAWDDTNKELSVSFNPYFYEMYMADCPITAIDLEKRLEIKSPVAKALHRFVMGQSNLDGRVPYKYAAIARALNMNMESQPREIRRQLKSAMRELIKKNVLANDPEKDPFLTGKEKEKVRLIRAKKSAQKMIR